ncbi:MAG: PHP-associated domain-containing protein, partial [Chloroflexota bacterium]
HSSERSDCGKATEEAQIRAAIAAGLDALVFTDHWRFVPPQRLQRLNDQYAPFKIFSGIEVTANDEDFLVVGVRDAALEKSGYSYAELHARVRAQGGFIALAHPFRFHSEIRADIERFKPDAIEVRSPHTPEAEAPRIREIATRLGIPTLCNSDAHTTDPIGKYYNVLARAPGDEQELIAILRNGWGTHRTDERPA